MTQIAGLESVADFWERLDYLGLFLVFVGVTIESLVEFTSLTRPLLGSPGSAKRRRSSWSLA